MMSVSEALLLQDLKRRVEAIERALAARRAPGLSRHNAEKIAKAEQLREAVRQVLANDPQPYRLQAKHVRRKLDLAALAAQGVAEPSLRTVRFHLAEIRGSTRVLPAE